MCTIGGLQIQSAPHSDKLVTCDSMIAMEYELNYRALMFDPKKVLILDPSPIFRRTLKEVIRTSETLVDIREADNIDQAEEILRNDSPDVVIFDIALPRDNGIEFIASIKSMLPESCVVVLTTHDSAEHETASIEQGADYFLSKEHSGGLRLIDVIRTTIRQSGRA